MHRFLMAPGMVVGDCVQFDAAEAHHALRVLRLTEGADIEISDGEGHLFRAHIVRIEGSEVWAALTETLPSSEPPILLTLYQGLPKFDKLELICQKATELGAMRIVPVRMSRSVVKLSESDTEKKRERMQKICAEAAKQCGRAKLPEVIAPLSWKDALRAMRSEGLMLMPWEEAHDTSMTDVRGEILGASSLGILIGPEGGISPSEAADATCIGARAITLGPRILRTETAAIASIVMAMQLWGDL